jgi:hypothetical protein
MVWRRARAGKPLLLRFGAEGAAGSVEVYVQLGAEGHVRSMEFGEKSGYGAFDRSIERLLEGFTEAGGKQFPLPEDARVREVVLERGMRLRNWKVEEEKSKVER